MANKMELIQKRGRVKGILTRLKTFAENLSEATSIKEITIKLQKADEIWEEFQSIEDRLLLIDDQVSEIEEYEEKYFEIKILLTQARGSRPSSSNNDNTATDQLNSTMTQFFTQQQSLFQSLNRSSSSQGATTRLPKLNIPTFSGEYKEWMSFKDLFESSIHTNSSLTSAQKLQYLKGLLKGNAANVIRHLAISDSNYFEAWEGLKARFDKKFQITASLIKTFLDTNSTSQPSTRALRNVHDTMDEVIRALRALGSKAEGRDPWLIYIAVTKLDPETRLLWSQEIANKDFPDFNDFLKFLSTRCDALETCGVTIKRSPAAYKTLHTMSGENHSSCPKCSSAHPLYKCAEFKNESLEARRSFTKERQLCFKCLASGHSVRTCRSKMRCSQCKGNHHPLLHMDSFKPSGSSCNKFLIKPDFHPPVAASSSEGSSQENSMATPDDIRHKPTLGSFNNCVSFTTDIAERNEPPQEMNLLPTVVATAMDYQGTPQPIRILLDSGSQVSLISEQCVQRLKLKRQNARLGISGLQTSCLGTTRGVTELNIFSQYKDAGVRVKAFIMKQLTGVIPSKTFSIRNWKELHNITLADPDFNKPNHIDLILGVDHFFQVLREGQIYGSDKKPIAQNTIFGWVVCSNGNYQTPTHLSLHMTLVDIDLSLRRFWETEEVTKDIEILTSDEQKCENHFKHNFSKTSDGRYIVSLPFKEATIPLGESKQSAINRLKSMETRFKKEPRLKEQYFNFMQEYCDLGHMELIPANEPEPQPQSCFYLPHHAVFKNAPETKIRVVFDGSSRSASGISLNENLLIGPVVQKDLVSILLNFRKHRVAFSADIEKMYRQVLVTQTDRDFQRIVWRQDPDSPIQRFRLTTVTYGTSCAPFLATRTLQQIANEHSCAFPEAAAAIKNCFYVDDLLSGCDAIDEAVRLKTDLSQILASGGFKLTKWQSNASEILEDNYSVKRVLPSDANDNTVKVLGVHWNSSEDVFSFTLSPFESGGVSKRIILSESSRIFDPLGWLAPLIVEVKILLQQIWLLKCDWDENLPNHIITKWERFKLHLHHLMEIKIPRRIYLTAIELRLHGFSDASEAAYGAVIYCTSRDSNGCTGSRLVIAKTRVAPLKQVSIPRLELCGALLLSRLMERTKQSLNLTSAAIHVWTDSTVVLSWLSDVPRKWKTYVANRTSEILNLTHRSNWRYVPSVCNPADLLTRGLSAQDLVTSDLWWNGPTWLSGQPDAWPQDIIPNVDSNTRKEERKARTLTFTQEISPEDFFFQLASKYSSFSKLIRILAYCLRLLKCEETNSNNVSRVISIKETQRATKVCLRGVQHAAFSSELKDIIAQRSVSSKSPLSSLAPFIDNDGILRVGGRLTNSTYGYRARHPVILPKHHPITHILVRELHQIFLHPGMSLSIGLIRQRYWILGIRDKVKRVIKECMTCFRQRTGRTTQFMGSLPEARVSVTRPFHNVGVDYAGPLIISSKAGRGAKPIKAYIALFVCLSTKAFHLELVSSLSTEAFISTLRRFISRRGIPLKIFSDNGTNFVGANRQINELHKLALDSFTNEHISAFLAQHSIDWSFIPPGAPHFGGIWEAGVKSVKWHLRRVVGEARLTFEEMTTLLTQIEAVLNSRPYGAVSTNPDDLDPLTPGHFLIGGPLTTLPEPDFQDVKPNLLKRWQLLQAMLQGFWRRWQVEYLTSLQERPKWRYEKDQLKEGELVIAYEAQLPPSKWLLGRIVTTHPGSDGMVRVVSLRTKNGIIRRAINKIYKLPIT